MKKLFILFITTTLFLACSSSSSDDPLMESSQDEMDMMAEGYSMGNFVSLAHPTSGTATVSLDKMQLDLKNFKTDGGPRLLLYLSTDNDATEYVDLGDLQGLEGDYTYVIPDGTDVDKYKIVNVWCVDFLVSFGVAELKKN